MSFCATSCGTEGNTGTQRGHSNGTACQLKQVVEAGLLPSLWWAFIHQAHYPILLLAEKRKTNTHKAPSPCFRVACAILRPCCEPDGTLPKEAKGESLALGEQMREKMRIARWGASKPPWAQDKLLDSVSATWREGDLCVMKHQAVHEALGRVNCGTRVLNASPRDAFY